MTIECPHCHTTYTATRCGVPEQDRTAFTVKCLVCKSEFDGMVEKIGAIPPSRLYKYTGHRMGTPGTPEAFRTVTKAR
jgi:predicted Zn finger-like uncharacterized protein